MGIDYSKIGNLTPKKYKFILSGNTGTFVLDTAPLEWASIRLDFKRDLFYMAVFTEAVFDTLTFIEQGKDILKGLYDTYGAFAECNLTVQYLDRLTLEYVSLPTTYKLDFNTYDYTKVGKAVNAVQIAALPVDINAKLMQRENTNVDLTKRVSLDGFEAALIDHWASLKSDLNFPQITAYYTAYHNVLIGQGVTTTSTTYFMYFDLPLIESDFDESQSVDGVVLTGRDKTYSILKDSTEDRTLLVNGTIDIYFNELSYDGDPSRNTRVQVYIDVIDSSSSLVTAYLIETIEPTDPKATGSQPATITIDETLTVGTDESVIVYALAVPDGGIINIRQQTTEYRMREAFIQSAPLTVESFPVYEAMERNLQLIMSKQRPLYSDFFGRTDVVKNAAGDFYASENQERFANVLNGLSIRGLVLSAANNNVACNFRELFKTLKAMYNIGAAIELNDGELKLRIEELAHFFQDSETLDLSDRIEPEDIGQMNAGDWQFAKIKTGYNKAQYEENNGRGEYNTLNERTTEIPNDTNFDNVAPYRADTRSITNLIANPIDDNGSTDVRGEDDIYIVKTQDGGTDWDAETDENIQVLNDTSLFQEGSLNLFFTPVRNMLRHNFVLRAGLDGNLGTYLRFQTSDKNSSLQTTDGADNIIENADIIVSDLGDPLWSPIVLNTECEFFEADYVTLKNNPKGYITLSDDLKGWVLELNWEMTKNLATIKLLKKWA